jgi:hypothetical protein
MPMPRVTRRGLLASAVVIPIAPVVARTIRGEMPWKEGAADDGHPGGVSTGGPG